MNAYAWIRGDSRGNPGPAAIGAVIKNVHGEVLAEISEYLGKNSRQIAEYEALIAVLAEAKRLHVTRLVVYTDSMQVREQTLGVLKAKATRLEPLVEMARILIKGYESFELMTVDEDRNKEAERLVQKALEGIKG